MSMIEQGFRWFCKLATLSTLSLSCVVPAMFAIFLYRRPLSCYVDMVRSSWEEIQKQLGEPKDFLGYHIPKE